MNSRNLTTTSEPIHIIGIGASTPVGLNAPATAAAVRSGVTAMADHPFMIDKEGTPMVVCANPSLPIKLEAIDRFLEMALTAAQEALSPILKEPQKSPQISILIALPEKGPGKPNVLESNFVGRFSSAIAERITIQDMVCHSLGYAGGLLCMEQAQSLILSGKSQVCLVGGVDSYLSPETLGWLDDLEQLHSESTIWGFCPGEGAGFCLLASRQFVTALGLSSESELVAAASTTEINLINTETVCIGQGLSEAFQKSLSYLPDGSRVDHTICDLNGEPYRGNEYAFAVLRTQGFFTDEADFMTPADCWGDVGAASGPLFALLAVFAARKGYGPGPYTLLWASSECGLRGTVLLRSTTILRRN